MDAPLDAVARRALAETGAASAVIFLVDEAGDLALAASAGITGAPLDGLVAAVRLPNHPVTMTVVDAKAAFDVTPMAPGGPALRSHLPLMDPRKVAQVIGVLALAHQEPLTMEQRRAALDLADEAAVAAAQGLT
jgi:hypothetical protein